MESLVHRIQHGNNTRVEEAKLYHEIRNLSDTIEIYEAPTGPNEPDRYWGYRYRPRCTASEKQYTQQVYTSLKIWSIVLYITSQLIHVYILLDCVKPTSEGSYC